MNNKLPSFKCVTKCIRINSKLIHKYKCDKCDKIYGRRGHLLRHKKIKHNKMIGYYTCLFIYCIFKNTPLNMIISNISNIKPEHYNDILDILGVNTSNVLNITCGTNATQKKYNWKPIRENFQTKEIISFLKNNLKIDVDTVKPTPIYKYSNEIRICGSTDLQCNNTFFELKKPNTKKWTKFKIQAIIYLTLYTQKFQRPMKLILTDLNDRWFYFYSEIDTFSQQCIIHQKMTFEKLSKLNEK